MITVDLLQIRHYKVNCLAITYQLSLGEYDSSGDYFLELHRSENPDGNFRFVTKLSWNKNSYIDPAVDTCSKNRFYYYAIKIVDKYTGEVQESSSISVSSKPDIIALDVVRRERLLLKNYIETKCYFLLARTFGTYCHECYDATKRRRTNSKCRSCYGTGFECGFFDPIEGYINISPNPLIQQVVNFGPSQVSLTQAWTTNYPILKVNDFIVEVDTGCRWRINQVAYNEKTRYKTKQILGLNQESRGSIIYDIETPGIWVSPW